jgi:hypothetical protein
MVEQTKAKVMIGGVTTLGLIAAVAILSLSGPLTATLQFVVQILRVNLGIRAMLYGESRLQLCDQHVLYLPKISPGAHSIDMAENSVGKILMIIDKSVTLYTEKNSDEMCTLQVLGEEQVFFVKKENSIEKKCHSIKVYGPLKERTKTIKDLKEGDLTKNLEKTLDLGLSREDSKVITERIRN